MNTFFTETTSDARLARVETTDFATPKYEVDISPRGLSLRLFLPDIPSSGIEITHRGPDLIVTARRSRTVRINFRTAHLESALHDYRLALRVGYGFDSARLSAALRDGILALRLPAMSAKEPQPRKVA